MQTPHVSCIGLTVKIKTTLTYDLLLLDFLTFLYSTLGEDGGVEGGVSSKDTSTNGVQHDI